MSPDAIPCGSISNEKNLLASFNWFHVKSILFHVNVLNEVFSNVVNAPTGIPGLSGRYQEDSPSGHAPILFNLGAYLVKYPTKASANACTVTLAPSNGAPIGSLKSGPIGDGGYTVPVLTGPAIIFRPTPAVNGAT